MVLHLSELLRSITQVTVCAGEVVEQGEPSFTVHRRSKFYSHYEYLHDKIVVSQIIETNLPQDLAVSLFGIHPQGASSYHKDIAALCIITKNLKTT